MTSITSLEKELESALRPPLADRLTSRPRAQRISLEQCVVKFAFFDILTIIACAYLPAIFFKRPGGFYTAANNQYNIVVACSAGLFFLLGHVACAYQTRRILERFSSIRRLSLALCTTFVVLILIGVATKSAGYYSRVWFFSWAGLSCVLAPLLRFGFLFDIKRKFEQGAYVFRALSVGMFASPLSRVAIAEFSESQTLVVEKFRLGNYGELENLAGAIALDEIDQIYIVTPWVDAPDMLQQLLQLRQLATEIYILPEDSRIHAYQLGVSTISDRISLHATTRPINGWDLWAKRAQDVVVAAAILFFFAPLMTLVAFAIRLESPGPALFRQKRVGFNGRQFELLKFRSMYHHSTDHHANRQTSRNDDRVTRVGRFIRRTSIDELPQFFNVLQGDMSVVGPRPHALLTKTNGMALSDISDQYAARHRVKPGLTGWAQVKGYRGELDTNEKVRKRVQFDIDYIENWSIWLDIKIILRTALLLVYDPSAY
jgi:polysaccharide biosynthesis protein PslA